MAGVAGLVAVPALIAACSHGRDAVAERRARRAPAAARPRRRRRAGASAAAAGSVSIGSNHSDPGEQKGMAAVNAAFTAATGIDVEDEHGRPQHVPGPDHELPRRHAGHRLHVVLRLPDEVLRGPGPRRRRSTTCGPRSRATTPRASPTSVVGNDSKVYGIPVDYYPWAVFYRKSVFADKGYTDPRRPGTTSRRCARRCRRDGLTPIAFGDKDGWPAMGTFDILNLRLNGYDFHVGLMAGKEKWTDPKVTAVFQKWAEILPFHAKDYAGLTWQDAADTLVQKKSGMYLLGLFVSAQFAATKDPADLDDLDFFPFPTLGHPVRRREGARRADRHLADRGEVAEPRGRDGRRPRRTSSSGPRARRR